jgi:hypothetical protein
MPTRLSGPGRAGKEFSHDSDDEHPRRTCPLSLDPPIMGEIGAGVSEKGVR